MEKTRHPEGEWMDQDEETAVVKPAKLSRTSKAGMLAASGGMATFTTLLTAAVLSRLLTKADYAAYRQTILTFGIVSPILGLGLGQALYYFVPREPSKSRSLLTGNLLVLSAMGLLFGVAMLLGGNKILSKSFNNPSLSTLLLIFSPYALFVLPMSSVGPCLMSLDKVKALVVFNVFRPVVILAMVCGAVLMWRTTAAAVGGITAASFLLFIAAIVLMYRACQEGVWRPKLKDTMRLISFGITLAVAGVLGILFMKVDKVIVSSMCSPSEFAVYVNGATEVPLIGLISGSAAAVLLPEFSRLFREGNTQKVLELWHRAIIKAAHILIPLSCLLFVVAPEIMTFLFSSKYRDSAFVFRIYLLEVPLRAAFYGPVLIAAGKRDVLMYRSAAALAINVPLSMAFVRMMGPPGAAVATVLVICGWAVTFSLHHIRKCVGASIGTLMPWGAVSRISLLYVGVAALLLGLRLFGLPSVLFLLVAAGIFGLCFLYSLNRAGMVSPMELMKRVKSAAS